MRLIVSSLLALGAIAAAAALILTNGSDGEPEAVAPTARPAATPTAPAPESTATATAEPEPLPQGRERHTTLIELETGTTFGLYTETHISISIAFSPDSRWLAFGRTQIADLNQGSSHRLDLRQSPDFEVESLGRNYYISSYSSRGDLALRAPNDHPVILTSSGELHELAREGHVTSWSPDGRWLSYRGPYEADEKAIPHYLVDTETWEERRIAATPPCNCEGGPRPIWAPDSGHFVFAGPGIEGSELHNPQNGTSVATDANIVYGWLDATHYVKHVNGEDNQDTIVSVDILSGASETLFDDPGWSWIAPDWQHIAIAEPGGGDVRIRDRGGNIVADGIRGGFGEWSADGSLFVTYADNTECGKAALVYMVDGDLLVCAASTTFHEDGSAAISPDNHYVATVRAQRGPYPPADNDIYVTDLATGVERLVAADLYGDIVCIDWSPDSRFLVVGHGCGV